MADRVVVVYRGGRLVEVGSAPLPLVADRYCSDKAAVSVEGDRGQYIDCRCWRCRRMCGNNPDCFKEKCLDTGICRWDKHS